jgi:hypothetical protein
MPTGRISQPSAEFTGSQGRKIFFSPTLDSTPEQFTQWWGTVSAFEAAAGARAVPIGTYNGNELRLFYKTSQPGYLIFVDNWDPYWRATIDGKYVPLVRSFNTFKAISIRPGKGIVTFEYSPWLPYRWFIVLGAALAAAAFVFEIRRRRQETAGLNEPQRSRETSAEELTTSS